MTFLVTHAIDFLSEKGYFCNVSQLSLDLFYLFVHLYILGRDMTMHVRGHLAKTIFFPFTTWVPRTELRLLGSAADDLIYLAILPVWLWVTSFLCSQLPKINCCMLKDIQVLWLTLKGLSAFSWHNRRLREDSKEAIGKSIQERCQEEWFSRLSESLEYRMESACWLFKSPLF